MWPRVRANVFFCPFSVPLRITPIFFAPLVFGTALPGHVLNFLFRADTPRDLKRLRVCRYATRQALPEYSFLLAPPNYAAQAHFPPRKKAGKQTHGQFAPPPFSLFLSASSFTGGTNGRSLATRQPEFTAFPLSHPARPPSPLCPVLTGPFEPDPRALGRRGPPRGYNGGACYGAAWPQYGPWKRGAEPGLFAGANDLTAPAD